jgi:hypothetical protein
MTDNIIKFQKPIDLHKELAFRMNVVSTAEKLYINRLEKSDTWDNGVYDWFTKDCLTAAKVFHEIAQPYIDEIMAKIEKEAK